MSVRVMSWVWEHSSAVSTQRFVLLAIADCANDAGAEAYPSMATLVKKTRLGERTVQEAIKKLAVLGELVVSWNAGPRGCNKYRIVMKTPAAPAPPQEPHPAGDAPTPPQEPHPTPAGAAGDPPQEPHPNHPLTIHEPSLEPSLSPNKPATRRKPPPDRPDVEKICRHLADRIVANGSKRPTIGNTWRTEARLLLDADGRTVDQVIKAIDWCQADGFWQSNILSMPKLREKYDQLRLAAQRPTNGSNGHRPFRNPTDPSAYEGEL